MKIALCLYGVVGGKIGKAYKGDSLDILNMGYEQYRQNILEHNDVDVLVHSWSTGLKREIIDLYKPHGFYIEEQKHFHRDTRTQNHFSRWYSTQYVINMATSADKYDMIMVTRFDIAWNKQLNFLDLNPKKFYIGNWCTMHEGSGGDMYKGGRGPYNDLPKSRRNKMKHKHKGWPYDNNGILDLWFIGNPDDMQILAGLYDEIPVLGSKYEDSSGRISSHHMLPAYLDSKNILQHTEHKFCMSSDFPLIRREYFGSKQ